MANEPKPSLPKCAARSLNGVLGRVFGICKFIPTSLVDIAKIKSVGLGSFAKGQYVLNVEHELYQNLTFFLIGRCWVQKQCHTRVLRPQLDHAVVVSSQHREAEVLGVKVRHLIYPARVDHQSPE